MFGKIFENKAVDEHYEKRYINLALERGCVDNKKTLLKLVVDLSKNILYYILSRLRDMKYL